MSVSVLKRRRAQLKMGENIAILLVFFILFGIGFIFYYQFYRHNAGVQAVENFDARAISISQKVFFLPELQCAMDNAPIEGCIDLFKAKAFGDLTRENPLTRSTYYNVFGFSTVSLFVVSGTTDYPPANPLIIYSNPINDTTQDRVAYTSVTMIPVLVYEPLRDQRSFGVLNVTIYRR